LYIIAYLVKNKAFLAITVNITFCFIRMDKGALQDLLNCKNSSLCFTFASPQAASLEGGVFGSS